MSTFLVWVDIPAVDISRAVQFYNEVFGWELSIMDFGDEKMACFPNGEGAISQSSGFKPSKDGIIVNLNVGDKLDACITSLLRNGGSIVQEKTKIEAPDRDYFALFIDTEGNRLGLYGK